MPQSVSNRLSTGIAGLDEILNGGLIPNRSYLIRGGPGCGKTTLGLHFLTLGAANGEKSLFITFEESEAHIRSNAKSLNFDLNNIEFLDLSPTSEFFAEAQTYDIFSPAEVERDPITQKITESVNTNKPQRVFIDPMTQFRYLSADVYQFRRQVLSFLHFLIEHGATVLFSSEGSIETPDDDLQFMSDGIIDLEAHAQGRLITVKKFRGSDFRAGSHSMCLTNNGIEVYPRLIPMEHRREFKAEKISSGVPKLDEMLNGGFERGTITLISGPTGVGKTTLGLQFMKEAAGRGERSVIYSFDEEIEVMLYRAESINIPAREMIKNGTLHMMKVEPLHYSADEFDHLVRRDVEKAQTRLVMIDSISGYKLSVRGEDLVAHLHALSKYLQNIGVATLLINDISDVIGNFKISDISISYLADNIIFLRYLEMRGELRRAIGVLKKRMSNFEKNLREFQTTQYGIKVGQPLTNLRGILLGTPEWITQSEKNKA